MLLRGPAVTRPNQGWAMDITYIPMAWGSICLATALDWYSRRVLAWWVSIAMDTGFGLDALEEALLRYGTPDIVNSDQGTIAFIPMGCAAQPTGATSRAHLRPRGT